MSSAGEYFSSITARIQAVLIALAIGFCGNQAPPVQAQPAPTAVEKTYEEWNRLCSQLPTYKALQGNLPPRNLLPLKTFQELDRQIANYFTLSTTGDLARAELWVGPMPNKSLFFNPARAYYTDAGMRFQPFAQKLTAPPDAEIFFHGDLHGDIHSLMAMLNWMNRSNYLNGFTLLRANTRLIILGDFTDRGVYSTEVLYTLLRLKIANPSSVFLCRGNHEDIQMMARYGFLAEGRAKYGDQFNALKTARVYDFIPAVIYLGCGSNFVQCSHAGMEPGYRPVTLLDATGDLRFQEIGRLKQNEFFSANAAWFASSDAETRMTAEKYFADVVQTSPTEPQLFGFMWNDFTIAKGQGQFRLNPDRGYVYGDELVRLILTRSSSDKNRVRAVFRGHQHSSIPNPMMSRLVQGGGLFRHWQPGDSGESSSPTGGMFKLERGNERPIPEFSVWTFNVAPDSAYGLGNRFHFDTFGILRVGKSLGDWKIQVINQRINAD